MVWRRAVSGALALPLVLATVVGCSNRSAPINKQTHAGTATASAVDGVQELTITSGVDLRFHPSTLIVQPGKVRITLINTAKPGAGPPHNLQVTGLPGAFIPTTVAGDRGTVTFTAPAPGTYTFVCLIHQAQNQTGKLIVR
jgi:plastocyanin